MSQVPPTGCSFLIQEVGHESIFCPEKFSEEQHMFAQTAREFMDREVLPHIEAMEHGDFDKMAELVKKSAEPGLLMMDIPEEYGGLGVDKTTSFIVTEYISQYASFSVSFGAHTGIGTLPLLLFGNHEQKTKWLPKLATGELLAAYALTEPGSGSDAMAAKTKAVLDEDGEHYILNGTKMWITNAGFADLFTVFCQVEGTKFTAFLVERDRAGVDVGVEEKKMGIKGSSTRQLILEDVKVPKENLLGEIGKGHKIAFNILNIGRFKLGVGVAGAAKRSLGLAVRYAGERHQFGQPLSDFGAIRSKLGDMATQIYGLESMVYRVAGYMDQSLGVLDTKSPDYIQKMMDAIEEYSVEDSIMKVVGSEVLDFVVDESVQIHGGYGYSQEYEVERLYRDSRINRIFEGTNEINRMLIPGTILKRTMKGQLNLFEMIQKVEAELGTSKHATPPGQADDVGLALEKFLTDQGKRVAVYAANQAIQKHMADLREQQEILMDLADMIIEVYRADSTVARTLEVIRLKGAEKSAVHRAATRLITAQSYQKIVTLAQNLLCHLSSGEKLNTHMENIARLAPRDRVDQVTARRKVAEAVIELQKYPF